MARAKGQEKKAAEPKAAKPEKPRKVKRNAKRQNPELNFLRAVDKFSAGVHREREHRQDRIAEQKQKVAQDPNACLDAEGMKRLRENLAVSAPTRPLKSLLG